MASLLDGEISVYFYYELVNIFIMTDITLNKKDISICNHIIRGSCAAPEIRISHEDLETKFPGAMAKMISGTRKKVTI